jgi:hypothetical protein
MTEETRSLATLNDEGLEALLQRAFRNTLIVGLLIALALWIGSGWRNAAMMGTGTIISAASLFEWRRLIRLLNAKLDRKQAPKGALAAATFFVLRLIIFAGVIYGSLKCFRGSMAALLFGLGLAVAALVWEALRLLRG